MGRAGEANVLPSKSEAAAAVVVLLRQHAVQPDHMAGQASHALGPEATPDALPTQGGTVYVAVADGDMTVSLITSNFFPFGAGVAVRHLLNIRFTWPAWRPALAGTLTLSVLVLYALIRGSAAPSDLAGTAGLAGVLGPVAGGSIQWTGPAGQADRLAILLGASLVAIVWPIDWTILCGLLVLLSVVTAARRVSRSIRELRA